MQLDPLPGAVLVTIFMEGLRAGVARTEVFLVHPAAFEAAVDVALNAEFNFKAVRYGTHSYHMSMSDRSEPMDLCLAETDEELQAAEQHLNVRQCFTCGSTKHLLPRCPLRKPRQAPLSQNPVVNQRPGKTRENFESQ